MARIQNEPNTSTRLIASRLDCSKNTVHRVLKSHNLHPFKLQKVQHLLPGDPPRRLEFCEWLLGQADENADFLSIILTSDEKGFSREGTFNPRNNHEWSEQNPHATHIRGYQQKFGVNVWAGILGDHLIGPYVLPNHLNGNSYLVFLRDVLPGLLEDVPLQLRREAWFQHDGCPAHFARTVRGYLDQTYNNRWIGRGGPVPWPARSPDLAPLDYFLWAEMERLIYATPVPTMEDLVARVVVAAEFIANDPGVFARVRESWVDRCRKCIEMHGEHFEHLLHY